MKKKRVYKILYGVLTAMLSLRPNGEEPSGEQEEERLQPVGTSDGSIAAPAISDVVAPEVVEESTGIEPVAEEPEVTEEPIAEVEDEEPAEIVEEQEPAEIEEVVEEQELAEEPDVIEEQPTEEVVEEEQPQDEQEVQEEPAEEIQEEAEAELEEEAQEEEPAEGIDTRFPTVDGLCFEWQEQTQTYTVTGVDETQQRITRVVIPQELFGYPVTEIGDSAFRGCRFLTEVVVPEGVTRIGHRAFYGCYALERVELPDSLTSVGDEMFYLCMAITSQTEFDNAYYLGNKRNPYVLLSIHKSRDVDSCVIHQRTKFIDRGAFAECRSLAKIEIPSGVLGIGCKAFYRCVSLESVTLGSGLVHIGDSAFYGCSHLSSVEYTGTREAWGRITIDANNEPLTKPVMRFRPTFSRPQ
ncbi:MAG: leucine-rich repeat domain-containing protein [Clostridia bacterium]|nr:leucine-rich repeat domain-containing protein [Clostridia bacterium]